MNFFNKIYIIEYLNNIFKISIFDCRKKSAP